MSYLLRPEILGAMQKFLDEIFRDILGQEKLVLNFSSALLIFKNNFFAASLSLFLGVFLGFVPLLMLAVNFFILGFLFAVFVVSPPLAEQFPGFLIFLLSLLPHGILEIPALLLAAALGLRFGFSWVPAGGRLQNLKQALWQNLQILPWLLGLLFLAAVAEIFITGNLVNLLQ